MKFSVSSGDLLNQLLVAAGAIGQNPVVPVLEDFHVSISHNVLTISTSNLETTIITSMEVIASDDGVMAVPAKILMDTLKALPEQPVTINHDEMSGTIEILSSYGKYKLSGDNPEDFPAQPEEQSVQSVKVSATLLSQAINKTSFATSSDEVRLAMTGVYMHVDFNKIIFVATDAHKMVKYSFNDINSDITASIILPKKSLVLLKNNLPQEGDVEILFNNSHAFFKFGNTQLICRLVDAKYPDYNSVIPFDNPYTLTLDKNRFQSALKRIAIYANKTTNQVVLNINDGSLTLSAQDLDFSNEATEQVPCQYDGETLNIGFNAKFLLEMLSVMDSEEVYIKLSSHNRAGILYPLNDDTSEELLMLIMPVLR